MGMLYDAQKAGAPILVTAGQHDQSFNFTEPHPVGRPADASRGPFVKWSAEVRRLADLPRMVHRAAKTALAPPIGPVFLSLPGDVLNAEAELDLGAPTRVAPRLRGDRARDRRRRGAARAAERPVIIAGDAVAQGRRAAANSSALAELLGAPVYAEGMASTRVVPVLASAVSAAPWRGCRRPSATCWPQHDLLLSVGADLFTLSLPSDIDPMPPDLPIIHLDTDPWELGKNYAEPRSRSSAIPRRRCPS